MWPHFKQASTRKTWSAAGPDVADTAILWIKVGPLQAVRVGPRRTVLTTSSLAILKQQDTEVAVPDGTALHRGGQLVCVLVPGT